MMVTVQSDAGARSPLIFAVLLSLITACTSRSPDADYSQNVEQKADLTASAEAVPANELTSVVPQYNSECDGFVDGSSRRNTLNGVKLGDSISKVNQQLICGEIIFDIEEGSVSRGSEYAALYEAKAIRHIWGHAGNEHAEAEFIGLPGNERLVAFKRIGEYNDDSAPSVENVAQGITGKYKQAKILDSGGVTRIGFGSSSSGMPLAGDNEISACNYDERDSRCGFTLYAMIFPDSRGNPGLVRRYEVKIFDSSYYNSELGNARAQLEVTDKRRMDEEIKGAAKIKGI